MGSESNAMPNVAGSPISKIKRTAQSMVLENSSTEFDAYLRDKYGKITVTTATPKTPIGTEVTRSEKYNQDKLPWRKNDAKKVSINTPIWPTETPNTAG